MDKEQYIKFSDAQIGSTINRPVLVSAIAENTARNGNTFVRVSLKDGFSEVTAMMFDASAESLESLGIRQNTIADTELSVSEVSRTDKLIYCFDSISTVYSGLINLIIIFCTNKVSKFLDGVAVQK